MMCAVCTAETNKQCVVTMIHHQAFFFFFRVWVLIFFSHFSYICISCSTSLCALLLLLCNTSHSPAIILPPAVISPQACLKAVPAGLLGAYVAQSEGSGGIGALAKATVMIAFALASHEATDFKGRQVLSMVPIASGGFAAMMVFRYAEVMARLLAIWTLVGLGHPIMALGMLLGLDPVMMIYLAWSAYTLPAAHKTPLWVELSRCCVYLDHRTQAGALTLEPAGFFAVRGAVHLAIAAYAWQVLEAASWNLPSGIGSAELAWTVAMVACHGVLIGYVSEQFWKSARVRPPSAKRHIHSSSRSSRRNRNGPASGSALAMATVPAGAPGSRCSPNDANIAAASRTGGDLNTSPRRRLMQQLHRAKTPLFGSPGSPAQRHRAKVAAAARAIGATPAAARRIAQTPSVRFLADEAALTAAVGATLFRSPSSPERRQRARVAAIAAAFGATPASVRYAPRGAGGGRGKLFSSSPRHRTPFAAKQMAAAGSNDGADVAAARTPAVAVKISRYGPAPPRFSGLETPKSANCRQPASALKQTPRMSALRSVPAPTATPLPVGPGSTVSLAFEEELALRLQKRKKKSVRVAKFAEAIEKGPTEKKSARFAEDGFDGVGAKNAKSTKKKTVRVARFADDGAE